MAALRKARRPLTVREICEVVGCRILTEAALRTQEKRQQGERRRWARMGRAATPTRYLPKDLGRRVDVGRRYLIKSVLGSLIHCKYVVRSGPDEGGRAAYSLTGKKIVRPELVGHRPPGSFRLAVDIRPPGAVVSVPAS
jgi:hypothetical protein